MKFMLLVHETTRPSDPPAELFAAIGAMGADESKAGTLLEVGGMLPIQHSAIVTLADGAITTTDGPSIKADQPIGGYSIYELADLAEANTKAQTFLKTHLDTWPGWEGWVEIRPLMQQPPQP